MCVCIYAGNVPEIRVLVSKRTNRLLKGALQAAGVGELLTASLSYTNSLIEYFETESGVETSLV